MNLIVSDMWWSYEDVRERKERVRREIAKRVKRGEVFTALDAPQGNKKLTRTFWGKAWCDNLESYQQYEYRLPRGKSYLRQGLVYNLSITPGLITATVAGSELYECEVTIQPLAPKKWQVIVDRCAGQVSSLLDLLGGKLGDGVLEILTDENEGLFPKPKEIRFNCSCPDHADMCKHISAVLYGVGVLLDTQPELFFTLRKVEQGDLLRAAGDSALGSGAAVDQGGLVEADLSALFGIDLATTDAEAPVVSSSQTGTTSVEKGLPRSKPKVQMRKTVRKPKAGPGNGTDTNRTKRKKRGGSSV